MELLEKWIYECLGALIKEPTEENRKIVAKTIASEIEDREKGTANRKLLPRIEQLEKDVIENESDCSMCDFPKLKTDFEKQLTEAKEIIYDFYDSCKGNGTTCVNTGTRFINFVKLVDKAEAFLKEQNYDSKGTL